MEPRGESEADLYRRYEKRIVDLEWQVEQLEGTVAKYVPIVDALKDAKMLADALAERLVTGRTVQWTRVQVSIAILALFVPSCVTAGLTVLIIKTTG